MTRNWIALSLVAALALASNASLPARADSPAPAARTQPTLVPTEAEDQAVVETAMADFQRNGFSHLATHLDALKTVMAHAPASYGTFVTSGEVTFIHPVDQNDTFALVLMASAQASRGRGGSAVVVYNVYPTAALLLASYADEMHHYQEGLDWAKRGLAMQPGNWMVALEGASCAMALHRAGDALAILETAITSEGFLSQEGRARLLRNKGSSLAELNRLDEAETALNESIRLMPNNDQARAELGYIARLRAGGQRTDIHIAIPRDQQPQSNDTGGKPAPGN